MTETKSQISFSKREGGMPMPHLLDIQTAAFESLMVPDDVEGERQDVSLERVFRDLFPISDVNGKYELTFKSYAIGEPKYSVEECIERDMTYAAPLKATLALNVFEDVDGQKRLKNQIEKEVYLGELPIMTPARHLRDQRRRARRGEPAAPLAGRGVRGGDAPQRAASLLGADHSVPGLVGRVHHRHPRRHLRPHRQEEEVPGLGAAPGLRPRATTPTSCGSSSPPRCSTSAASWRAGTSAVRSSAACSPPT